MGGEVSRVTLTEPTHNQKCSNNLLNVDTTALSGVSTNHNTPNESKYISTERETKISKPARKTSKIVLVAKNKQHSTEKKVLELIQKHNSEKIDYEMLYNIIDKHFFMQSLNKQARDEIITTMSLCKIKANTILFKQGSVGSYWYIVNDGVFQLFIDEVYKKDLKRGDSFGEFALMNDAPRSATIKANTDCYVWVLKREAFRKIIDFLFQLNYDENMKFLNSINLPLDATFKSVLANNLIKQIYKQGDTIFKEGELGTCMFIIKKGEVNCVKDNKVIRVLKKGDNFGQKAIITENKRSLDVIAKTDCILCSISIEFFRSQFGDNYKNVLYWSFIEIAFRNSQYFKDINTKLISKISNLFTIKNYKNGEVIFKKGENINNKLVVVLEGNVYNKLINKIEAKRYEFLFEKEMFENKEIMLNQPLFAEPDCLIAEIDYSIFRKELGGDISNIQKKSNQLNTFENITLFKNLSEDKLESIQNKIKIEKFDNGKKIIVQGEIGDKFYIIKSGRVDFFVNSKYVRSFNDGEEFGAKSLIISERRTATAIANGKVELYTLTSQVFKSLLEPNLLEYFKKKFYLEDNTIELKDLDYIKELGKGNFGFVNLVRSRKNKQLYAIKALNLKQIKKEKLETCVELEKNVLLKVDHPFIMKMVKYLKNEHYIFFIMEYIRGKELWEVIRDIGLLNRAQTQFYGASMFLAIDYLHKKKIIYRDIKPENIMVNDKGYIKIIDFGTVKEIKERTSTIIGTPHYMAPEIVKGEGYSFQVDIWSIAVCLYEFFCGKLPFGEDYEDPMDVYKAVAKEDLAFPSFVHDEDFMNLMIKMLKKSPLNRLWKLQNIKEDSYFKGFDWNKLISLSLDPPYKLKLKNEDLNSNNYPYLNFLKSITKPEPVRKKQSTRQLEFEKWVKDF